MNEEELNEVDDDDDDAILADRASPLSRPAESDGPRDLTVSPFTLLSLCHALVTSDVPRTAHGGWSVVGAGAGQR